MEKKEYFFKYRYSTKLQYVFLKSAKQERKILTLVTKDVVISLG